jgi:hypothetical protein
MIAERAPAAGLTPGKGTLTDELTEDEQDTDERDIDEQVTQPVPVRRSVFDSPFAQDVATEPDAPDDDEAPTTKRRG